MGSAKDPESVGEGATVIAFLLALSRALWNKSVQEELERAGRSNTSLRCIRPSPGTLFLISRDPRKKGRHDGG